MPEARYAEAYEVENTELRATVERLQAGADRTPVPEGARMAPGQLWHRLVTAASDERAEILARLLDAAGVASRCAAACHDALLPQLRDTTQALAEERTTRAAAVRALREALSAARPIVAYVSAGRGFVDVDPYPDGEARRVNAVIADLLDPP
jgi:hypothetical protein